MFFSPTQLISIFSNIKKNQITSGCNLLFAKAKHLLMHCKYFCNSKQNNKMIYYYYFEDDLSYDGWEFVDSCVVMEILGYYQIMRSRYFLFLYVWLFSQYKLFSKYHFVYQGVCDAILDMPFVVLYLLFLWCSIKMTIISFPLRVYISSHSTKQAHLLCLFSSHSYNFLCFYGHVYLNTFRILLDNKRNRQLNIWNYTKYILVIAYQLQYLFNQHENISIITIMTSIFLQANSVLFIYTRFFS